MAPFPLPKFDRLGRSQKDPNRLFHGMGGALVLGTWMPPKLVPPEFWSLDADDAGEPLAIVACPCGRSPEVELLGPITACEDEERYFFFDGRTVWVWRAMPPDERTIVQP